MGNNSSSNETTSSKNNNIVLKNKLKPYLNVCNDVKHAMIVGSRATITEDMTLQRNRDFDLVVSASFLLDWIDENNLRPEITQIQDLSNVGFICVQMEAIGCKFDFEIPTDDDSSSARILRSHAKHFSVSKSKMIETKAVIRNVAFAIRRSHIFIRRGISVTNFAKHCKFYAKMKKMGLLNPRFEGTLGLLKPSFEGDRKALMPIDPSISYRANLEKNAKSGKNIEVLRASETLRLEEAAASTKHGLYVNEKHVQEFLVLVTRLTTPHKDNWQKFIPLSDMIINLMTKFVGDVRVFVTIECTTRSNTGTRPVRKCHGTFCVL